MMKRILGRFKGKDSVSSNALPLPPGYIGKAYAILGDSISTLDRYVPAGYRVFYAGDTCISSQVFGYMDTWWGKVIDYFDGELLVNNSWSGSRVTGTPGHAETFPAGCSDERTHGLHLYGSVPDVILIYLGTNDWADGTNVGSLPKGRLRCEDSDGFLSAYCNMLGKIKVNYPHAKICCMTLNRSFMSLDPEFAFPDKFGGVHIDDFNQAIRYAAKRQGCQLIDTAQYKELYDSIDGTHPNAAGMATIAELVIREMLAEGKGRLRRRMRGRVE